MLNLVYEDNGIGFFVDEKIRSKQGMGLKNIESRIHSLEGIVLFDSRQSKGMKATIKVPYKEIPADAAN